MQGCEYKLANEVLHKDVVERGVGLVEVQGVSVENEDVDKSLEVTFLILAILGVDEVA